MSSIVEIGGILGWATLVGPLLVLAAALMMALFWPHRVDATVHDALREPVVTPAATPGTARESGISNLRAPQSGEGAHQDSMERPEPLTQPLLRAASGDVTTTTATEDTAIDASLSDVTQRTARDAPSPKTETVAARALLDEALRERAAGHETAAAECLRGAIMLASKAGDRTLHAAARLELGDIAQAEGDLQTACEHWQLARSLFEEEQSTADAAKCETRMTHNRCPTDWVLNDF